MPSKSKKRSGYADIKDDEKGRSVKYEQRISELILSGMLSDDFINKFTLDKIDKTSHNSICELIAKLELFSESIYEIMKVKDEQQNELEKLKKIEENNKKFLEYKSRNYTKSQLNEALLKQLEIPIVLINIIVEFGYITKLEIGNNFVMERKSSNIGSVLINSHIYNLFEQYDDDDESSTNLLLELNNFYTKQLILSKRLYSHKLSFNAISVHKDNMITFYHIDTSQRNNYYTISINIQFELNLVNHVLSYPRLLNIDSYFPKPIKSYTMDETTGILYVCYIENEKYFLNTVNIHDYKVNDAILLPLISYDIDAEVYHFMKIYNEILYVIRIKDDERLSLNIFELSNLSHKKTGNITNIQIETYLNSHNDNKKEDKNNSDESKKNKKSRKKKKDSDDEEEVWDQPKKGKKKKDYSTDEEDKPKKKGKDSDDDGGYKKKGESIKKIPSGQNMRLLKISDCYFVEDNINLIVLTELQYYYDRVRKMKKGYKTADYIIISISLVDLKINECISLHCSMSSSLIRTDKTKFLSHDVESNINEYINVVY